MDLQRIYTDIALLFTDVQCPTTIFGVWNPSLKEPRRWRVMSGYNAKPVPLSEEKGSKKEKELVILNEQAILKEMTRMGEGIVERVELLKSTQNDSEESSSEGSEE